MFSVVVDNIVTRELVATVGPFATVEDAERAGKLILRSLPKKQALRWQVTFALKHEDVATPHDVRIIFE